MMYTAWNSWWATFLPFAGTKFLCSEVIAPIRSEIDDISLYIINFEDLTHPQQNDSLASRFSKCKLVHPKLFEEIDFL